MIELEAQYYDGVTSRPHTVRLSIGEDNVVHVLGLEAPLAHPLASLGIAPRLGNTVRSITFPGGAKCETDDHAALDALERRLGRGRGAALIHALESRSWTAGLSALIVLVFLVVSARWGIPWLARRTAEAVPRELAFELGKGTLAALDMFMKPSELDADRRGALEAAFARTARDYPDLPLRLVFRRGMENAFALPDGTVVVLDELVELAKTDEEVLAVLAHEIGHVHHRHALRMALESSAIVLLVSTYLGDVTAITSLSSSLPGVYVQAQYSRDEEREADRFALAHLRRVGIAPRHFAAILTRLQASAGPESKGVTQYLESHPPTSERIRLFQE